MRFWPHCLSVGLLCWLGWGCTSPAAGILNELPSPSADNGYEQGVSAPFAGLADGGVVVAGGCNFPQLSAAQGGSKRFYADIYRYDIPAQRWDHAGTLPQPTAYGASATVPQQGVICAGGRTPDGVTAATWLLTPTEDSIAVQPLPPMPAALENCAGAYLDGRFYVAGDTTLCIYDLRAHQWFNGPAIPAPRLQPTLVAQAGRLWLFGGYDPRAERPIADYGFVYDPVTNLWSSVANPHAPNGQPLLGAGGCGIAWGKDQILCFGGVDAAIFTAALARGNALLEDPANDSLQTAQYRYMTQEPHWYRFNPTPLRFHTTTERWQRIVEATAEPFARAGGVAVAWPDGRSLLLFQGETKPGVRTPAVWQWQP